MSADKPSALRLIYSNSDLPPREPMRRPKRERYTGIPKLALRPETGDAA